MLTATTFLTMAFIVMLVMATFFAVVFIVMLVTASIVAAFTTIASTAETTLFVAAVRVTASVAARGVVPPLRLTTITSPRGIGVMAGSSTGGVCLIVGSIARVGVARGVCVLWRLIRGLIRGLVPRTMAGVVRVVIIVLFRTVPSS